MKPGLDNDQSCFVCRRRADGLGINKGSRIGWMCQLCAEDGYGVRFIAMPKREFDRTEREALAAAGDEAGAYLDSIGCTDLAKLKPAEWTTFCERLLEGFGEAMRRSIGSCPRPLTAEEIATKDAA